MGSPSRPGDRPGRRPAETRSTSGRLLIVDCHETAAAAQAARYAREAGIPTIIDVEKVRPGIADLLQNIDAIIAAQEFPTALTGHEDLGRALEAIGREFGAARLRHAREGGQPRLVQRPRNPHAAVRRSIASTAPAPGDAFRGAFAAGCLRAPDDDLEDVLSYANAVAALNCRALGARGGIPTADEVERLLTRVG